MREQASDILHESFASQTRKIVDESLLKLLAFTLINSHQNLNQLKIDETQCDLAVKWERMLYHRIDIECYHSI
jgi:hypothetical protein